ncbi:hypothetical protein MBLNU457_g2664t1 [Dothideomycetes sp. NU457]
MPDVSIGLLTKTLHDGPVVQKALRFQTRDASDGTSREPGTYTREGQSTTEQGIVYVGERFIQAHEVVEGHLKHLATINDFDCKIVSAVTFPELADVDGLRVKQEYQELEIPAAVEGLGRLSHSLLAVTLASAELVLLFPSALTPLARLPLPASLDPLQCFGKFLAAEPYGRAIAVAAPEGGILLVEVSNEHDLEKVDVVQQRPLIPILGTILHMEFLYPPAYDPDHIILLVIKVIERKIFIQHVEWLQGEGTATAKVHSASRIHTGGQFPTLLVPLQSSAAFLLACGTSLYLFTDLLSGHVQQSRVTVDSTEDLTWTAFARPMLDNQRREEDDTGWLSTERGLVFQFMIGNFDSGRKTECSLITDLGHPVTSIFTIVDNADGSTKLLLAGSETSSGGIYQAIHSPESDWDMDGKWDFAKIDIIQNWTPTLDLISSDLPRGHEKTNRFSDGLFVTSSSHQAGNIAELRVGLEARSAFSFSLDELRGCHKVWAVPKLQADGLLLVVSYPPMSGPGTNRVLSIDEDGVSVVDLAEALAVPKDHSLHFEPEIPIVTMGSSTDTTSIVHITDRAFITFSQGQVTSYPLDLQQGERIVTADLDLTNDQHCVVLVIADSSASHTRLEVLAWYGSNIGGNCARLMAEVASTPSTLQIMRIDADLFVVAVTAQDGRLLVYLFDTNGRTVTACGCVLGSGQDICDSIVILREENNDNVSIVNILCGLRSGSLQLCTYHWTKEAEQGVHSSSSSVTQYDVDVSTVSSVPLGSTSVKLTASPETPGTVIAVCEASLFLVTCSVSRLSATPIWVTDLGEPGYQQGPISALVQTHDTPGLASLGLASSLIVISEDECRISELDSSSSRPIPRTLPVQGSPNRLLYSKQLSHFIVASTEIVKEEPSDASTDSKMQIRGLLNFRTPVSGTESDDGTDSTFKFYLQTNERVYALAEWIYRSPENKKYVFILVATGIHDSGTSKGRIHILQPSLRRGKIDNMTLANTTKFDSPVYALSLFGPLAYIACAGNWLVYAQYSIPEKKWVQKCRHRLNSPAVHITTSPPYVHITTAADSLTTFTIEEAALDDLEPSILLRPHSTDTGPAAGLHHVTISSPSAVLPRSAEPYTLNVLSTKTAYLRGLLLPQHNSFSRVPSPCLFHARLPQSLTRLAVQNVSPTATTAPIYRIVGTSTDGSMTELRLLSLHEWAGIKFLTTLLRRSKRICPFSYERTLRAAKMERAGYGAAMLPLGLRGLGRYEGESEGSFEARTGLRVEEADGLLYLNENAADAMDVDVDPSEKRQSGTRFRPEDMHIDGDVLQRLLDRGGEGLLREILDEEAENQRGDRVADYVRDNRERELESVKDVITQVMRLLGQVS